jgi:indolepyruvate ferredoxin oxidoreductase
MTAPLSPELRDALATVSLDDKYTLKKKAVST